MDILKMMSQFKDVKSKMKEMEEKLKDFAAEGQDGEVKVKLNGKFELINVTLPTDISKYSSNSLQKKIMIAYNDAFNQIKKYIEKEFGFLKNGLGSFL